MSRKQGPLIVALLLGVLLRAALALSYTPVQLSYPDTWGYLTVAQGPLFPADGIRPAGYPVFLLALHAVSASLSVVVVVQQALGILTAVLAYATLRRLAAPIWVAVSAAAAAALNLDLLYSEHNLLSEALFTPLLAAALYALVRGLDLGRPERRPSLAWLAAAGLAVAAATTVRTVTMFLVPIYVLAVLWWGGPGRRRVAAGGTFAAVAVLLIGGYVVAQGSQTGDYALSQFSGWALYARTAPFADCRAFRPPPGTTALCESSDVRTRGGPDMYAWAPSSPARRLFGGPGHNDGTVGAFARAAVLGQPKAYLSTVATDLWRYVDSDAGTPRPGSGGGPETNAIDGRDPAVEALNRQVVEPWYGRVSIRVTRVARWLGDLQRVLRVHGALVLLACLLSSPRSSPLAVTGGLACCCSYSPPRSR
jgi:hypothetical protein